ncbi:MAG: bifunctional hydroxymethylpyrimidine kinase/phosphomethylpyrimidine kinase, partial [Candidatus Omnitrophica bacterium]|nr:bifunctional hydroxymethylpyrimidine kinase/phosphomethylpyrimidine kinase [Candidatus Omnitrophota bacterium]
ACNVASNICSLGGKAEVVGVVGTEGRGRMLMDLLRAKKIGVAGIVKDPSRPTTLKTRVVAHHQQVVRIDREELKEVAAKIRKQVLVYIKKRIHHCDAICIEDYGKGLLTADLVQNIVSVAKAAGKVISVDPKEDHLSFYRGATTMTPNHHEASKLAGIPISDDQALYKVGSKLLKYLSCENILITRGENGMCLFQKRYKPVKIPTLAQDVFDVSGAGDTVIGTYTLSLALGASPVESAHLANCAAGIVVGKVGTATVGQDELISKLKQIFQS